MSSFTIYEVTSHNDVEIHEEHTVKEVAYFENVESIILTNWFYKLHGTQLKNNIMEYYHYVEIDADDLLDIIEALDLILNTTNEDMKNVLAVQYFPVTYIIRGHITENGMLSEEYYKHLTSILYKLKKVLPSDSISNRERLFLYKIH